MAFSWASPTGVTPEGMSGQTRERYVLQDGIVRWDSPAVFTFDNGGKFKLWLEDDEFCTPGSAVIQARIAKQLFQRKGAHPWGQGVHVKITSQSVFQLLRRNSLRHPRPLFAARWSAPPHWPVLPPAGLRDLARPHENDTHLPWEAVEVIMVENAQKDEGG